MIYIADLMTTNLFTLKRSDSLRDARSLMQLARIRHIPIVDGRGGFVGLLTHRDILSATISRFADVDEHITGRNRRRHSRRRNHADGRGHRPPLDDAA